MSDWDDADRKLMLENALRYAELGMKVFPTREIAIGSYVNKYGREVPSRLKSPYLEGGFLIATSDKNLIHDWWKKFPLAGIGLACGMSGLTVVDIDVKGGRAGFENWMSLGISDENTLHSMTPSGGLHIVYKGVSPTHANVKAGVDIRSSGAYIVAPPSRLYNPDGSLLGAYYATDDWFDALPNIDSIPSNFDDMILSLRMKGKKKRRKKDTQSFNEQDHDSLVRRAKIALDRLAILRPYMAEDYFEWINIGMALKQLGDEGFELWNEWSQTCPEKYEYESCLEKWDTFKPKEITIGTLFHYAWEYAEDEE